jgi:hypothetical protein
LKLLVRDSMARAWRFDELRDQQSPTPRFSGSSRRRIAKGTKLLPRSNSTISEEQRTRLVLQERDG